MEDAKKQILVKIFKDLPPEDVSTFSEAIADLLRDSVEKTLPPLFQKVLRKMGHTDEAAHYLDRLEAKTNDSRADVLIKALALYEEAVDIWSEHNRLAVLNQDDEILKEITELDRANLHPQPVAK